jgi:hypothetical protein
MAGCVGDTHTILGSMIRELPFEALVNFWGPMIVANSLRSVDDPAGTRHIVENNVLSAVGWASFAGFMLANRLGMRGFQRMGLVYEDPCMRRWGKWNAVAPEIRHRASRMVQAHELLRNERSSLQRALSKALAEGDHEVATMIRKTIDQKPLTAFHASRLGTRTMTQRLFTPLAPALGMSLGFTASSLIGEIAGDTDLWTCAGTLRKATITEDEEDACDRAYASWTFGEKAKDWAPLLSSMLGSFLATSMLSVAAGPAHSQLARLLGTSGLAGARFVANQGLATAVGSGAAVAGRVGVQGLMFAVTPGGIVIMVVTSIGFFVLDPIIREDIIEPIYNPWRFGNDITADVDFLLKNQSAVEETGFLPFTSDPTPRAGRTAAQKLATCRAIEAAGWTRLPRHLAPYVDECRAHKPDQILLRLAHNYKKWRNGRLAKASERQSQWRNYLEDFQTAYSSSLEFYDRVTSGVHAQRFRVDPAQRAENEGVEHPLFKADWTAGLLDLKELEQATGQSAEFKVHTAARTRVLRVREQAMARLAQLPAASPDPVVATAREVLGQIIAGLDISELVELTIGVAQAVEADCRAGKGQAMGQPCAELQIEPFIETVARQELQSKGLDPDVWYPRWTRLISALSAETNPSILARIQRSFEPRNPGRSILFVDNRRLVCRDRTKDMAEVVCPPGVLEATSSRRPPMLSILNRQTESFDWAAAGRSAELRSTAEALVRHGIESFDSIVQAAEGRMYAEYARLYEPLWIRKRLEQAPRNALIAKRFGEALQMLIELTGGQDESVVGSPERAARIRNPSSPFEQIQRRPELREIFTQIRRELVPAAQAVRAHLAPGVSYILSLDANKELFPDQQRHTFPSRMGRISTPRPTDYLLASMICGPTADPDTATKWRVQEEMHRREQQGPGLLTRLFGGAYNADRDITPRVDSSGALLMDARDFQDGRSFQAFVKVQAGARHVPGAQELQLMGERWSQSLFFLPPRLVTSTRAETCDTSPGAAPDSPAGDRAWLARHSANLDPSVHGSVWQVGSQQISGTLELIKQSINPQVIGTNPEENGFRKWWSDHVDPAVEYWISLFSVRYQKILDEEFHPRFSEREVRQYNGRDFAIGVRSSLLEENALYAKLLEGLVRDASAKTTVRDALKRMREGLEISLEMISSVEATKSRAERVYALIKEQRPGSPANPPTAEQIQAIKSYNDTAAMKIYRDLQTLLKQDHDAIKAALKLPAQRKDDRGDQIVLRRLLKNLQGTVTETDMYFGIVNTLQIQGFQRTSVNP